MDTCFSKIMEKRIKYSGLVVTTGKHHVLVDLLLLMERFKNRKDKNKVQICITICKIS